MGNKKQLRQQFGVSGVAIVAAKAYVKPMEFDHPGVKAESWILVTPDQKLIRVNTYDGNAGRNFDPSTVTHAAPSDAKELKRKLKGYTEVPVTDCPVAIVAA